MDTKDRRERDLLQAMHNLVEAILSGNIEHPYLLLHVDYSQFRGTHDRIRRELDIYEFLDLIRELNETHYPQTGLEITDQTVDFGETAESGEAVVWQFIKVIRFEEQLVRNGLRMSKWIQNSQGIWKCFYAAIFRCDPLVFAEGDQLF